MPNTYAAPLNLAGVVAGLTVDLTWDAAVLSPNPTSLLLHLDTDFADSSPNTLTPTSFVASISAAQVKFGAGAALFPANQLGQVWYPVSAGSVLDLGLTGDFTIEGWVWANPVQAGGQGYICIYDSNGEIAMVYNSGSQTITGNVYGNAIAASPNDFLPSQWNHLALSCVANIAHLYVNGVAVTGALDVTPTRTAITSTKFQLGLSAGNSSLSGYIDEWRVSKGLAVYTANFTPPAAPFTAAGDPPPGYDVYRDTVSIASFLGGPAYTDTPPGYGTYTYEVTAWSGSADISPKSVPLVFVFAAAVPTVILQPKFVPAIDFKVIMVANPGYINPRVYEPVVDTTVRIKT